MYAPNWLREDFGPTLGWPNGQGVVSGSPHTAWPDVVSPSDSASRPEYCIPSNLHPDSPCLFKSLACSSTTFMSVAPANARTLRLVSGGFNGQGLESTSPHTRGAPPSDAFLWPGKNTRDVHTWSYAAFPSNFRKYDSLRSASICCNRESDTTKYNTGQEHESRSAHGAGGSVSLIMSDLAPL